MLESVKIQRRQSEIRSALAGLVGKEKPTEDETRSMEAMDLEYRQNETRYRAALIAEDTERREAGKELETREGTEWSKLVDGFECRQVVAHYDEGRALEGATAEVVSEMRSKGSYRGIPVPWQALEKRAGETIASGVYSPTKTMPVIDRIFADAAFSRMGVAAINIDSGSQEWPITSSSVTAGWQTTETGAVAGPTVYTTAERSVAPNNTLGIQMKITRRALKQSGAGLEQAVRRDMQGCIAVELDRAVFRGAGGSGEPAGLLVGSYGITSTAVNAAASWGAFRSAVVRFMVANSANGPGDVRLLVRPEVYDQMDGIIFDEGSGVTEWDRLTRNVPNVVMSSNALAAPGGSPDLGNTTALLTVVKNGVAPAYLATFGGIDVVRDVYSDAASGGLRLTALVTADVTATRAEQLEILTNVQVYN
ncbi:MAG: phage major capsid protein [Pseudomonadota bacterium]